MTDLEINYSTLIRELLEEVYTHKRETGKTTRGIQAYVKGFFDAGLQLGLITEEALSDVVEEMNLQVFGKSLGEQKEMFQEIHSTYEDYIDVPAYFRKGKFFLRPDKEA